MKTSTIISVLLLILGCMTACSDDSSLDRLDETIKQRELFLNIKKNRVDSIRHLLTPDIDRQQRLNIYNELFQQYLTFNFDSALMYVDYASDIIEPTDGYELQTQVEIHRALSLATSGHFSHAINILKRIDSTKLPPSLLEEYFSACEWTYGVWAAYSDKRTIAPEFNQMSLAYLDSLIAVTDVSKPEYTYRLAERHLRQHNLKDAKKEYLATLARIPVESRLYAQAAYALASTYRDMQNKEKYKEWMVNAAISDQKVPLKENLALQQLAIFLKEEEGDIKRANYYLELALEDAIFYNNRLRMLEAAEKIPDITTAYQNTINAQNKRLKFYILLIGLLTILLVVVTAYIHRQRKIVSRSKDEMEHLNEKLRELNMQLSQTNKSRQEYVSLFMDLCATYIEKLNRFPIILKLKVKNMGDLNSVADRYVRPTDTETREMFQNFDSAFLRVYPDYIRQFNALLRPDKQIYPRKGELLNTDLRIYALVRMGITDSNKIATLLFLSSQTIFNHRTQVRNRAIDRDNFEKEVANLCEIYP